MPRAISLNFPDVQPKERHKVNKPQRQKGRAQINEPKSQEAFLQVCKKENLNKTELKKDIEILKFLEENRDGKIKDTMRAVRSTQRGHVSKENLMSPTSATEVIIISGVIEGKEKRYLI